MNIQTKEPEMREHIFEQVHIRRSVLAGFALAAVVLLAMFAHAASPAIQAQTASNDCFGGALSDDPIHCEVFEWAHNTGVIEVDAVYRVGKALHIFLTQADHRNEAVLKKMLAKTQEVARRTGEHGCVLEPELCDAGVLVAEPLDISGYILPVPSVYKNIRLFQGGAEARRSFPGWRAFQELWPEASDGVSGTAGTDGDFDISGVDRTSFPALADNCYRLVFHHSDVNSACRMWDDYSSLRIANIYSDTWNDKVYFYVKAGTGEEEVRVATAKTVLMNSQPDTFTEDRLVVVSVPHDFEELWRWSLVLDRFANSSGNTLGITHVELDFNTLPGIEEDQRYLFPSKDAPDLTSYIMEHEGNVADGLRWRLIIEVETFDFEKTVAGLPRLLKQLEIPDSAVGLILEQNHRIARRAQAEPITVDLVKIPEVPLDRLDSAPPTPVGNVDIEPDVPLDQPAGDAAPPTTVAAVDIESEVPDEQPAYDASPPTTVADVDIEPEVPLDQPAGDAAPPTTTTDADIEPEVSQDQTAGDAVLTPTASGDVPLPPTVGNDSALRFWWVWAAAGFAVLAAALGGTLAFRRRSASEDRPTT